MFKKFPSDKTKATKNTLSFLLQVPTHHSFTSNLFAKFISLKLCVGFSIFEFHFIFSEVYIFVQQKYKIPFKIKIIEKLHTDLLPDL